MIISPRRGHIPERPERSEYAPEPGVILRVPLPENAVPPTDSHQGRPC